LENGWEEVKYNVPDSIILPKEYILKGSGIFSIWTKKEYDKVKSYLNEYIKQVKITNQLF
jgi:hypothetical protein